MRKELKIFIHSLLNFSLWHELALSKIRARFNRTVLGPLWEILGSLVLLLFLGFLWAKLWNKNFLDFFTYLYIGFTLWRVILSSVTDANMLLSLSYINIIKNIYLHPFVLCISSSYKNCITLLLNLPIIFFILVLAGKFSVISLFYCFFFLLIFFLSNICITYLFSVLCLRYRDLEHTINVFFGILFFFTPIIWELDQLGDKIFLVQPNILFHYIEFFRSGLINSSVNLSSFSFVIIFTIILIIITLYLSSRIKNKINYWID